MKRTRYPYRHTDGRVDWREGGWLLPPVPGFEFARFVLHRRHDTGGWTATEAITGCKAMAGDYHERKQAEAALRARLRHVEPDILRAYVKTIGPAGA
jgi:hypothetical protein